MATFPSPNDGGEVGVKRCAATLEKEERDELAGIRRKGPQRPRQALDAPLLLKCGEGGFNPGIRQRLNRRSASLEVLRAEIAARQASRCRIQAKSNRRFVMDGACVKLKRLGPPLDQWREARACPHYNRLN